MRRGKRKNRITKGERLLYTAGAFALVCSLIIQIFCGANIGSLNQTVEKLKYDISNQEKKNESLDMKVSELTSYDQIKDIVKEMGLEYNNDNIVVINNQ